VADLLTQLQGADLRSKGHAEDVARNVLRHPALFEELLRGLWEDDPAVCMRAADAVEKVTRVRPDLLLAHKRNLLSLCASAQRPELRWHLAQIVPRLPLAAPQRHRMFRVLLGYLEDDSRIVRTFALQALVDLGGHDPSLQTVVLERLQRALDGGSPAEQARARKLLRRLQDEQAQRVRARRQSR
jgi:hypothetical protein